MDIHKQLAGYAFVIFFHDGYHEKYIYIDLNK